ncbi:noncanonical pyrimidine nucleotidase, YjjG family [Clostridium sp. 19966]|uniref:YjjG family noncanonical pyrimidine nucleotidase n=1 Tax=Clostridium sp. 19966 TaxID=2768166 RepID=UPI0028DF0FCF|nr:YjjG family noncanonical pyrimidine nucleotidase [Clostridium sp. 19966]MDT8715968.1 noncanonical pyrimidine nucleotidase, YjjG family [Clostridium sp. 19966]
MKYEVILFDADETLFDFEKSEKHALKNTMIDFNIDYNENYHLSIYKTINSAIWKELENGLIEQKDLNVERFRRLSKALEEKFDGNEFAKHYAQHLSEASFLFESSTNLIESLHEASYRLAIVTNGLKDVQHNRVRKSVIGKFFETVVISEEIEISKPNPEIFQYALNTLKCINKKKVLMVGDSLSSDIQGGINFGIDTCWYNPKKLSNKTNLNPTYEISDLMKLRQIV